VRLSERALSDGKNGELQDAVLALTRDGDRGVRYQLALSLGEWVDDRAAKALVALMESLDAGNPHFKAAALSSSAKFPELAKTSPPPTAAPLLLAPATSDELGRLRTGPLVEVRC
jgi:hypothetical protein